MEPGSHVVSFARTLDAFAFEDFARGHGAPGRIIPLPTGIAASCGLAWKLPPGERVALGDTSGLVWAAVHRYDPTGYVAVDAAGVLTPGPAPATGFAESLGLPEPTPGRPLVLTAVGAGGKTTLVHALADEFAARGLTVLATTTTNMNIEAGMALDPDAARAALAPGRVVLAGRPISDAKFAGFSDDEFAGLLAASDVVVIEGDGSKRLPMKVPAAHEPVVPDATDHLLVVAGMSALGRPLAEVCFRLPEVAALLDDPDAAARVLDPALAATLLRAGYLDNPKLAPWAGRRTIVASQAHPALLGPVEELQRLLAPERVVPWWLSAPPAFPGPPALRPTQPEPQPRPEPRPGDRP